MIQELTLYGTTACHLCEQAEVLLQPWVNGGGCRVEVRDISDSDVLLERYGVRIPVLLRNATGAELGWPFDAERLREFLLAPSEQ